MSDRYKKLVEVLAFLRTARNKAALAEEFFLFKDIDDVVSKWQDIAEEIVIEEDGAL